MPKNTVMLLLALLLMLPGPLVLAAWIDVNAGAARTGGFGMEIIPRDPCPSPQDLTLVPPPITVSGVHTACNDIFASGVQAEASTLTTFEAGCSISLGPGFGAADTAEFNAVIRAIGVPQSVPSAFVEDTSPNGETEYSAEFYLRTECLVMQESATLALFSGRGNDGNEWFRVSLHPPGARLQVTARLDDGTLVSTAVGIGPLLLGQHNRLKLQWLAGDGTGQLELAVNSTPLAGLANLSNGTGRVDRVRLGAFNGSLAPANTRLLLDDFSSSRFIAHRPTPPSPVVTPPALPRVVELATASGPLVDCDSVSELIRFVQVSISGGVHPLEEADDTSNYAIVSAGADGDFSTHSCSGGVMGDDVTVAISGISLTATGPSTLNAVLETTETLAPGLYRILVCDTITDANGNALDGNGDNNPGGDFVLPSFRADPFNLLANGHFDNCPVTLTPWTADAFPPNEILAGDPGSDDAEVSPLSASARFGHSSVEPSVLSQCIAVEPNRTYDRQARVRFNPLAGATARFERSCEFFAGSSCTGSSLGLVSSISVLEDEGGAWVQVSEQMVSPPGGVSALCSFEIESVGGGSNDFDAFLDGLFIGSDGLIFTDDYESGDTSAWASTVP